MPLTGSETIYKESLKAALSAYPWARAGSPELDQLCSAIASVTVAHLVANTVVNSLGLVSPVGPVTGVATIL